MIFLILVTRFWEIVRHSFPIYLFKIYLIFLIACFFRLFILFLCFISWWLRRLFSNNQRLDFLSWHYPFYDIHFCRNLRQFSINLVKSFLIIDSLDNIHQILLSIFILYDFSNRIILFIFLLHSFILLLFPPGHIFSPYYSIMHQPFQILQKRFIQIYQCLSILNLLIVP